MSTCYRLRLRPRPTRRRFLRGALATGSVALASLLAACGGSAAATAVSTSATATRGDSTTAAAPDASAASAPSGTARAKLQVVAAENFWGSIASQLGGDTVQVMSVITNPDTDPHAYEPTPADARLVATAHYVIVNGAGYDPWAPKLLAANPVAGRQVLTVGDLVGKKDGDNPHLWYSPAFVAQTVQQITTAYKVLDPANAASYDQQGRQFDSIALKAYHDLLTAIKQRYAGTPVGSTESIFVYLADALGLTLLTSAGFMEAINNGNEPTAAEKATFDQQIATHLIKVFINNKQNATPDTTVLKQKAQAAGIPVLDITETLDPATASFQDWQTAQLQALQQALAKATGQ